MKLNPYIHGQPMPLYYTPNTFLAFSSIWAAMTSTETPLIAAIFLTTSSTYTGSLRLPLNGTGATNGESV